MDELEGMLIQAEEMAETDLVKRRIGRERDALNAYRFYLAAYTMYKENTLKRTKENIEKFMADFQTAYRYLQKIDDLDLVDDVRMMRELVTWKSIVE